MEEFTKSVLVKHGYVPSPYLDQSARDLKADIVRRVGPTVKVEFYKESKDANADNHITIRMECIKPDSNAVYSLFAEVTAINEALLDKTLPALERVSRDRAFSL